MKQNIIRWTTNTLFPRTCVGCGEYDQAICTSCTNKIVQMKHQHCIHCTKIVDDGVTCKNCRSATKLFQLISACHYTDGPLKEALHTLKYHGQKDLVKNLANLLHNHIAVANIVATHPNTIVSYVPLFRARLWNRGFNQSELLAKAFAHQHVLPFGHLLKKIRSTKTQASLNKSARQANLADAFHTRETAVLDKTIILIDDITTTGATLNECAKVLRAAGGKRIIGITVARTD